MSNRKRSPASLATLSALGVALAIGTIGSTTRAGQEPSGPRPSATSAAAVVFAMPSGRSLAVVPSDGGGRPINLTSVAPPDEVQSVSINGPPAGGKVTLAFGGQATTPIPVDDHPQASYGLWTLPTTPGRQYSVWATYPTKGNGGVSVQLFEILDGQGKVIGKPSRQTMRSLPSQATDGQTLPSGSKLRWDAVGTFAATGPSHQVRVSATTDGQWYLDGLRVQDVAAGTIKYLDDQDGSLACVPRVGRTYKGQGDCSNGTCTSVVATGVAHRYGVDPALYGAAIRRGFAVAASDGSGSGPWRITFGGPLGGKPQPLITCDDPAVSVARVTAGGNSPSYSLNGGPPVPLTGQPLWVKNSPYALYILPATAPPIKAGDALDFTYPAGWATTTAGPVAPSTIRASNFVGGTILPQPSGVPSMEVGWNHEGEQASGTVPLHSNLATRGSFGGLLGKVVRSDPDGYPLKIDQPQVQYAGFGSQPMPPGNGGKGLPGLPNGSYTVIWDWDGIRPASDVVINPRGPYKATEVASARKITGKANNVRVYNLQGDPARQWGPNVQISYTGTARDPRDKNWWVSLKNLRIYPPDPSDPTGKTPWVKFPTGSAPVEPPRYHPADQRVVGHAQWLRFLDPLNSNGLQVHDPGDFRPASALGRGGSATRTSTNILSVVPVPKGVDPFFSPRRHAIVRVTTDAPHGLFTGQGSVVLNGAGTVAFSGGGKRALNGFSPAGVYVTGPTTFLMPILNPSFNDPPYNQTITSPLSAGGQVIGHRGTSLPIEEIVEICNQANGGAGCNLWWTAPFNATPECHAWAAAYFAKTLKGKLIVEAGNEAWNFNFQLYKWCCTLSYRRTGNPVDDNTYQIGYVARMREIHASYADGFAAAGRPATDVIRAMGTQGANSYQITSSLCSQVVAQYGKAAAPTAVDLLATATYFVAQAPAAGASACDPLTTGQLLDYTELQLRYGGLFDGCVASHRKVLDSLGMKATRIGQYEGGFERLLPGHEPANGYDRSWAALNHTRMNAIQLGYLQMAQDAGSSLNLLFYAGGGHSIGDGQYLGWCTYTGWDQKPGTGDPVADGVNNSHPSRVDQVKCQRGGAVEWWSSAVAKGKPAN